jgi:hypothetical protein
MEDTYLFSKSCINLSLQKSDYFLSAFPAKLIFGQCSAYGYIKSKYFEFELFQLYSLYIALFDIVNSFAKNILLEPQVILTKNEEIYFVATKIYLINFQEEKVAVFGVEKNSETNFDVYFTQKELNVFILTLSKILPCTLCLNSEQLELFLKASEETVTQIDSFQDFINCQKFAKKSSKIQDFSIYNFAIMINHYREIILIYKKIKSLCESIQWARSDNIELILQKM